MRSAVCLLFIVTTFLAMAQEPVHFISGAKELANTDVYSVVFDEKEQVLYVGSDQGLYMGNGGSFSKIAPAPQQKGSSLFDVRIGPDGVYCKNLRGQLFRTTDQQRLEVVIELSEQEMGTVFWYGFTKNRLWIITARSITSYRIRDEQIDLLHPEAHLLSVFSAGHTVETCSVQENGDIYASMPKGSSLVEIRDDKVRFMQGNQVNTASRHFFRFNNTLVYSDLEGVIRQFDSNQVLAQYEYNEQFVDVNEGLIIGRSQKKGAHFIQGSFEDGRPKFFERYFISAACMNQEGTLFLGTFKKGIIVVPDHRVLRYEFDDELLTSVLVTDSNTYVSTRSGILYQLKDGSFAQVFANRENIDRLFLSPFNDGEIPNAPEILFHPKKNIVPKDVWTIDEHSVLVALYDRLVLLRNGNERNLPEPAGNSHTFEELELASRLTAVAYSATDSMIYFGNNIGLFKLTYGSGKSEQLLYRDRSLIVEDIFCERHNTWIATRNHGLLLYSGGAFRRRFGENSALRSNQVMKIQSLGQHLFVLTDKGIALLNKGNGRIRHLGVEDGILSPNIIDFQAKESGLTIVYSSSVVRVPVLPKMRRRPLAKPQLRVSGIFVNSAPRNDPPLDLAYHENNLTIAYELRSFLKRSGKMFYRLSEGSAWTEIGHFENTPLTFNSLPDGKYQTQLMYQTDDTRVYSDIMHYSIQKPFWRTWWFISGAVACLLSAISIYYRHLLLEQRRRLETVNEINTSKITALQSQMNPHFIFNALNSIQALVLKGDTDNSYGFINKFSLLMRRTLTNSEKDAISLEEELSLLNTYLELEKLRFREDFVYEIRCDIDEDVHIPPMLIQPFVENSIIHGLLAKEGKKTLSIHFAMGDNAIVCTITDNGIGREKAKELNRRRKGDHESFAIRSIENRLKLLRNRHGSRLGYEFKDLKDRNGTVTGTRLTVTIPIL